MKLDSMMDKSGLESEPSITVSSASCGFKEVPSDGPTAGDAKRLKVVEVTRNVAPEMLLSELDSSQSSPGGSNSPSEVVVAGEEERDEGEANSGTYISHGVVSVMGRRRAMEDAVTVVPGIVPGELSFFAVYDGHGGAKVANACRDKLHEFLLKELKIPKGNNKEEGIEWGKVMMACFKKMDEEVSGCGSEEPEVAVGSTAAVVMVGKEVVVVANCGDSRVVLGRGGDAVPLSRDHKVPDRREERERVEGSGGRIINRNDSRVCGGVLATSKSIGNHYLKPYMTSEPEVTVNKRANSDHFLIIASNGLWDVVSNDMACQIVTKCLNHQITRSGSERTDATWEAAAKLAELAIAKGSKDNISVIVIELNKSQGA